MLLSHICRFIYLKTIKTGGTSVEIYFEPFCIDPARRTMEQENRAEAVTEWGIVGSRGSANGLWYNHMPAARVRELVGDEVWDRYLKFVVIRNPFDKVVSYFWHDLAEESREEMGGADFATVKLEFLRWLERRRYPIDRDIYRIGGVVAVDRYLRYERLADDLKALCADLGIPWQPGRLGRYKSGRRRRGEHFSTYYDAAAAAQISEAYRWELEQFQYPALQPRHSTSY